MLSIKGNPSSPDGERAGDVNIRVDLPEAGGDRGVHPPNIHPPIIPRRMRFTGEMFERFANAWVAVPFEQDLGTLQTTLSAVAKGLSRSLRLQGRSRQRERIKRARQEERARDMRVEDPEQGPDREVIEGTGASSSRDGAGNEQEVTRRPVAMSEPQPRLAEPSVGEEHFPREQSDDADMADPDSDRRRPRESLGRRKRKQRESGSTSLMVKKAMNGWRLKRNGCEFTVVPDESCFSHHDSQGGPKLSDISKRRESIVCSTDGGKWRIVDRWDDKRSESQEHRETCSRGDKETPQDLPQEWTGSTRFRKSSEALCDYETENREHRETCSSDIEQNAATGRGRLLAGCERWHP